MLRKTTILFLLNLSVLCMAGFYIDERPDYKRFYYKFFPSLNGWVNVKDGSGTWEAADWATARVNCYLEDALLLSPWNAEFTAVINELKVDFPYIKGLHHGKEMYTTCQNGSLKIIPSEADSYENCTIFGNHNNKDCNRKLPYACFAAKEQVVSTCGNETGSLKIMPIEADSNAKCTIFGNHSNKDCNRKLPYAGFAAKEQVVSTCGNDTKYEFSNITGQCYKFHETSTLWRLALQTCYDEGAQLPIINSFAEAQVLKDIFNRHPGEEIYRKNPYNGYTMNNVFIGVYFWKQRNGWYTIDGNRLEDAGYNHWHNKEKEFKNRIDIDEWRVGVINRDGEILNLPKYWRNTFICEKDPVV